MLLNYFRQRVKRVAVSQCSVRLNAMGISALLLGSTLFLSDAVAAPLVTQVSSFIIDDRLIDESSALARSNKRADVLWTLNDSGGAAALYALSTSGKHLATLRITGRSVVNFDWEDLASFHHLGNDYLLIGDIGDNFAFRPYVTLYLVKEPKVKASWRKVKQLSTPVIATYRVSYPDGARDAEALAVDANTNTAYIISKRDARPALYSFSLASPTSAGITLTALGPINIPRTPAGYVGNANSFNWVTAMSFNDAYNRVYVGTLKNGYLYTRGSEQSWAQALATTPDSFKLPDFPQIEGGTFAQKSDSSVFISSEQLPAHMARIETSVEAVPMHEHTPVQEPVSEAVAK